MAHTRCEFRAQRHKVLLQEGSKFSDVSQINKITHVAGTQPHVLLFKESHFMRCQRASAHVGCVHDAANTEGADTIQYD